jgi:hypothetical protein
MNNRYTIVILTIVLAAGTGAAVASALQASRVLDATGLHIRGTDGKLYARLESWVGQVQADGDGQPADTHGAHLVFYDEDGKVRLTLGTQDRGAYVSFFDAAGAEQIRLRLDDATGPSLRLSDGSSRTLIEPGPQ